MPSARRTLHEHHFPAHSRPPGLEPSAADLQRSREKRIRIVDRFLFRGEFLFVQAYGLAPYPPLAPPDLLLGNRRWNWRFLEWRDGILETAFWFGYYG